jgi:hypothetical protein
LLRVRIAVAVVVTGVWALGCVVAFLSRDPGLIGLASVITPVMLAVVGWLFTQEYLDRRARWRTTCSPW